MYINYLPDTSWFLRIHVHTSELSQAVRHHSYGSLREKKQSFS